MPYLNVAPRPVLKPFVDSLWLQDDPRDASGSSFSFAPTRILPTGRVDLVVDYADPFEAVGAEQEGGLPLPPVSLIGPRTRPLDVRATGRTGLLIAGLHPWAAAAFLGDSLDGLENRWLDLGTVFGDALVETLVQEVQEAPDDRGRLACLERFLTRRFITTSRKTDHDPAFLQTTVRHINGAGGTLQITELARRLGVSRRHLVRRFTDRCGVPPKRFSAIVRFQKAAYQRRLGRPSAEIAARCGYHDQAHMSRAFAAFSGHTPGRFPVQTDQSPLRERFNRGDAAALYNTIYL